jgi:hypothetical protein
MSRNPVLRAPTGAAPPTQVRALMLARTIDDAVALYREAYPEDWSVCQNWPLQHALPHVAAKLRALGAKRGEGRA